VDIPYVMGTLTVAMGVALYNMDNVRHMWRAWRARAPAKHFSDGFPTGNALTGATTDVLVMGTKLRGDKDAGVLGDNNGGGSSPFPITDRYYSGQRPGRPGDEAQMELEEHKDTQYTVSSCTIKRQIPMDD
jgi:hypothetical protein